VAGEGAKLKDFLTGYEEGLNYTIKNPAASCNIFEQTGVVGYTTQLCQDQLSGWEKLLTTPQTQGKKFGWNALALYTQTLQTLARYANSKEAMPASSYFTNAYLP
jgi:hypothetical protein